MRGPRLDDNVYRSWQDFTQQQYRRANTFQLCIEELENDLYFDDNLEKNDEEEELNFDY
jgi:hypothetical protein